MFSRSFQSIFFICFGITAEVIFTAIKYNLYLPLIHRENINWTMEGSSYFWMIFIYASIPFLFPVIYFKVAKYSLLIRIFTYAILILLVEYISGFLLEKLTGTCPWEYTAGMHVHGYVRLDYLPGWILFGWMIEKLWKFLNRSKNQINHSNAKNHK